MSTAVTDGVRVTVEPRFHPDRSDPGQSTWFFSYTIEIANEGARPVRLMRRHWIITDGSGRVEHVEGPGVVGETPVLPPGARFRYTSFCPLPTSLGAMEGTYQMLRLDDGSTFDARIAPFALVDPQSEN